MAATFFTFPILYKWEVVQMDSYECILLLVFATGYILAVTKK